MYCSNCGKKLAKDVLYCPNCGEKTTEEVKGEVISNEPITKDDNNSRRETSIVLGIIAIVGVFLVIFAPISFVLSIIGLVIGIKANKNTNNTIGIVLNSISLFLSAILCIVIVFFFWLFVSIIDGGFDRYYEIYGDNNITENF
jgi:phosphate/sulfate permease